MEDFDARLDRLVVADEDDVFVFSAEVDVLGEREINEEREVVGGAV